MHRFIVFDIMRKEGQNCLKWLPCPIESMMKHGLVLHISDWIETQQYNTGWEKDCRGIHV